MQCCPKGSWPQLEADYTCKGKNVDVEGLTVYRVGSGNKGLLIIEDIFGIQSGRHKAIADLFADQGYNVFMPEFLDPYYNGAMDIPAIMANIKGQNYEEMQKKFAKLLLHMKSEGIEQKFFCIGFCWGVWWAFRMSAKYDCFKAISGPHPSLGIEGALGGSDVKLAEQIQCPAYLLPAGNDAENVKEKGQIVEILAKKFGADKTGTTEFPDMLHGWTVRGDLKLEKVSRDVHKALHLTQEYFAKFQ